MNFRKTFFTGALFLLLLIPSVSNAATLSDLQIWFSGVVTGGVDVSTQTGTAYGATAPSATWLDLKANDSDGSIDVFDGASVTLRWTVENIFSVTDCRISYPGASGQKTDTVSAFGSKTVIVYPSKSEEQYIEFICTRDGAEGRDVVSIDARATEGNAQESIGGSSEGGGATSDGSGQGIDVGGSGSVQGQAGTGSTQQGFGAGGGNQGFGGSGTGGWGWGGGSQDGGSPRSDSVGGYINSGIKITGNVVTGVVNGAIVAGKVTYGVVSDVVGAVLGFLGFGGSRGIENAGGNAATDKSGGGFGGKPGGSGGKPTGGTGGSGTGGKPGGSVPVTTQPDEKDEPPAKPKGK